MIKLISISLKYIWIRLKIKFLMIDKLNEGTKFNNENVNDINMKVMNGIMKLDFSVQIENH